MSKPDGSSAAGAGVSPGSVAADGSSRVVARRALAKSLLGLARGRRRLERSRQPEDLAALFLRGFEGHTQDAYAIALADWFVWLGRVGVEPLEATFETVESYVQEPLEDGRLPAPATVAQRLACLSRFYRGLMFAGLVDRNPVDRIERPTVREQSVPLEISKERARELIAAARASGPTDLLLVLLMLQLGLRVSEAVGAEIGDVSVRGGRRVLRIPGRGQATEVAVMPINGPVAEAIKAATRGRRDGPLLINERGLALSRQQAGRRVKRLGEQVGVPELHPDALRHAFGTLALEEGASLRDVQDGARHADPRTTRRYDRNRVSPERHPTHLLADLLEAPDPAAGQGLEEQAPAKKSGRVRSGGTGAKRRKTKRPGA